MRSLVGRRHIWLVSGVLASLLVVPAAHGAELKAGSRHGLHRGTRLAMPLPEIVQGATLRRRADGTVTVTARVRYRASNWRQRRGVARDRTMVTVHVARRWAITGPDAAAPVFHRSRVRTLTSSAPVQTSTFTLPAEVAAFVSDHGGFSRSAQRRRQGRRLVWIDIQQDRDFRRVDGTWDWREGTATNAATQRATPAFTGRATAQAAAGECSTNTPCGALTVTNDTATGIATRSGGIVAGTAGGTGVPIGVAGGALECFDSGGNNGSYPEGFANFDGAGQPQPYSPGTGSGPGQAVTESIAADDTIAFASNDNTADKVGAIEGSIGLVATFLESSLVFNTNSLSLPGLTMYLVTGTSTDLPGPGAIVSSALNVVEAIIDRSCDGNPNLMALAAIEPGGGVSGGAWSASKQGFSLNTISIGNGYTQNGQQQQPSNTLYNGSPLYLNQAGGGPGVSGSVAGPGDDQDEIDIGWGNYYNCNSPQGDEICNVQPASSPTVASEIGDVDCGSGNQECPFSAVGFPGGYVAPELPAALASNQPNPPTTSPVNGNGTAGYPTSLVCGTTMGMGQALGTGQSVTSPNGSYTLTMLASGVLALLYNSDTGPALVWTSTADQATIVPGSIAALQTTGSFVVLAPGNVPAFSTDTPNTTNASGEYLSVQNDRNVVLYDNAGNLLWASGTNNGTCQTPGDPVVNSVTIPTGPQPVTSAASNGCATNLEAGQTLYWGQRITSPDGSAVLAMGDNPAGFGLTMSNAGGAGWNPSTSLGMMGGFANPALKAPIEYGSYATVTYYGNFTITAPNGTVEFQTGTAPDPGAFLAVQNDGNLVLYDEISAGEYRVLWASNTPVAPTCPAP